MGYYSPCPEREIWPFLKGSHISETEGVTPTKTGVQSTWHQSLLAEPIPSIEFFPKPETEGVRKLVCMHLTSIPTCIKFLSRFWLFFHDHAIRKALAFLCRVEMAWAPPKMATFSKHNELCSFSKGQSLLQIHYRSDPDLKEEQRTR